MYVYILCINIFYIIYISIYDMSCCLRCSPWLGGWLTEECQSSSLLTKQQVAATHSPHTSTHFHTLFTYWPHTLHTFSTHFHTLSHTFHILTTHSPNTSTHFSHTIHTLSTYSLHTLHTLHSFPHTFHTLSTYFHTHSTYIIPTIRDKIKKSFLLY